MTNPTDITNNSFLRGVDISAKQDTEKPRNEMGQKEFFDLMVAQLKAQDPLNPMDSNQFLGQVAQFSSVTGIQDMSRSFEALATSLQSSQALQASTLVGRSVLVPGSRGELAGEGLRGAVELPQASPQVSVQVTDGVGQTVRQLALGPQQAGLVGFTWDGLSDAGQPAPPGQYTVRAVYDAGEEVLAADTLVVAHVDSVTLGRGGAEPQLNLAGRDPVTLGVVRQIL